jgi:hypothetical protein
MIYEMVFDRVNDLQARWTDLSTVAQALSAALVNNPVPQGIFNNWANQIGQNTIPGISVQLPTLQVYRAQGSPGVPGLLATMQTIFVASNTDLNILISQVPAALQPLLTSADGQIRVAARIVQERLDDLRQQIAQGLQEIVEITTVQGGLANLAGIRGSVNDISTYPVLTQELGAMGASSFPTSSVPGITPLSQMVQKALIEVLGRRPRLQDPKSFVAALNQSFTCKETEGRMVCTWTPRGAVGQTELGATITGAQASLYQRAKVTLDNALPLLDQLKPLRSNADTEEVDAVRAIVRTESIEMVNELGREGGPRAQRVDDLFELLLHRDFEVLDGGSIFAPANAALLAAFGAGEVGRLGDVFGLTRDHVNTIEEEQNLTNYVIWLDYLNSLETSWQRFRPSFLGQTDTYFGTQLVLLQRALSVVAEQTSEVTFAMDSVFLGPAERQTVRIDFPAPTPPMSVEELLSWVQTYASEESTRIIQDGGKKGAQRIVPTLERLRNLVRSANTDGRIRHPAAQHLRIRRTLTELESQLDQAAHLAGTIR